jgi:phosphoglycerate dehydrogenase-like enzyme
VAGTAVRPRRPTVYVTAPPAPWLVGGLEPLADQAELVIDDDPAALAACVERVEVMFAWPCARAMLEPLWPRAIGLRWLHYSGAGLDHLLFPALVESRVVLTNSRGLYSDAIAEHALALMLALAKRLPEAVNDQTRRRWQHRESDLLGGKLLGIVGFGSIGRALAVRAGALGMRVWGLRRRAGPPLWGVERVLGPAELDCLLAAADWVVVAVPLTEGTRGLIGAEQLRRMKPSAGLVNVARGEVVDEAALALALREGWLRAAASDVFAQEPLAPTSQLYDLPNMLISPHMAPNAAGWRDRTLGLFLENFARYRDGRRRRNVVDKRRGY